MKLVLEISENFLIFLDVCGYEHCKFSSNKKSKVRDHTVHHVDDIVKIEPGYYFWDLCKFYAKCIEATAHNKACHPTVEK